MSCIVVHEEFPSSAEALKHQLAKGATRIGDELTGRAWTGQPGSPGA
jgi:hypothetical protein